MLALEASYRRKLRRLTEVTDGDWWFTAVELVHGAVESLGLEWQEGLKVFGVAESLEPRTNRRSPETSKIVCKCISSGGMNGNPSRLAKFAAPHRQHAFFKGNVFKFQIDRFTGAQSRDA